MKITFQKYSNDGTGSKFTTECSGDNIQNTLRSIKEAVTKFDQENIGESYEYACLVSFELSDTLKMDSFVFYFSFDLTANPEEYPVGNLGVRQVNGGYTDFSTISGYEETPLPLLWAALSNHPEEWKPKLQKIISDQFRAFALESAEEAGTSEADHASMKEAIGEDSFEDFVSDCEYLLLSGEQLLNSETLDNYQLREEVSPTELIYFIDASEQEPVSHSSTFAKNLHDQISQFIINYLENTEPAT